MQAERPIELLPCAYCGMPPVLETKPSFHGLPNFGRYTCLTIGCAGQAGHFAFGAARRWNAYQQNMRRVIDKARRTLPPLFAGER